MTMRSWLQSLINDRAADTARKERYRKEDQRREDEAQKDQERKDEAEKKAWNKEEQFEKELRKQLGGDQPNPDLDKPPYLPPDTLAAPVAAPQEAALVTQENIPHLPHQYDMDPLIPLTEAEVQKLKVIEAEDPQGRSMRAQFDPRTVLAMREQGEAAQAIDSDRSEQRQDAPAPESELDDDMDRDR